MIVNVLQFLAAGVTSSQASKLLLGEQQVPEKVKDALKSFSDKTREVQGELSGLDFENPLHWPIILAKTSNYIVNGPDNFHYPEDYFAHLNKKKLDVNLHSVHAGLVRDSEKFKLAWARNSYAVVAYEMVLGGVKFHLSIDEENNRVYAYYSSEEDKDMLMSHIRDMVWGDSIAYTVSLENVSYNSWSTICKKIDVGQFTYWGDMLSIKDLWQKFVKAGHRRTALIHGRPGMGKSVFCYHMARLLSQRTLICDHSVLSHYSVNKWKTLLEVYAPQMIIFDDIDRVSTEKLTNLFKSLEEDKGIFDVDYILCTSNDIEAIPEALIRPGRLGDEIYYFDELPPVEQQKKILFNLSNKVGYKPSKSEMKVALDLFQKISAAASQEYFKRLKISDDNVYMDDFNKILGEDSEEELDHDHVDE